ncbi:PhnD/SsuA/transferrin family substrate-binding protein [Halorubrum kocurii]|uniref:Phosphate/phosphonate ABC transporter substrate-binding protein n=1 Tax=Halorubrum kocurii JCM 14978 TaxID=1230456 RepID=M0NYG1_9EURY|nr:PhnD/SsuA/transferrin family substrate-binding protein [Halorubrum kocurii]EMA62319.1 phosphate/phosphonate ABC transporter substrate-binding protein [Halorubrum kocurii JCM 14978]
MSDNRWSADRRTFVKTAGAAGVVGLAGCSDSSGGDGSDDGSGDGSDGSDGGTAGDSSDSVTEVTWVLNPAEEEIDIQVQYQPLFEYLESEAEVEIVEQPTASYSGTAQELRRAAEGDRIFADVSPGAVAQIPSELDVTGMRVAYGAEKYFSLITTTTDSGIESLSDLEGELVASAAPTSVSGTLFPLFMLSNAGLDIGSAPSGSPEDFELRTSDHSTAREQLIQDDRIAAAGTGAFSTAAHVPQEQFDEMSQDFVDISAEYEGAGEADPELRLLAVSDPIPRAPIVSNAAWEESLKDDLRQLMIDAPQEAFEHESQADIAEALSVDPEILDMEESELSEDQQADLELVEAHSLWFSGVVEAGVDDYDPVAELGQELGLEWSDL